MAALAAIVDHDHARALNELLLQEGIQLRQQLEQQRIQMRQQELQIGEMRITNAWAQFHVHMGQTEIALDHLLGHYPDN